MAYHSDQSASASAARRAASRSPAEQRVMDLAEDIGALLGTAERKATDWLEQRKVLAHQLTELRDRADSLLRDLTDGGASLAAAVARGRKGQLSRGKKAGQARRLKINVKERKGISQVSEATRQKMVEAARDRARRKKG